MKKLLIVAVALVVSACSTCPQQRAQQVQQPVQQAYYQPTYAQQAPVQHYVKRCTNCQTRENHVWTQTRVYNHAPQCSGWGCQ